MRYKSEELEIAQPLTIALVGAAGRMGREIVTVLRESSDFQLVAAIDRPESKDIGRDIGDIAGGTPFGLMLSSDMEVAAGAADVLIDFSGPAGFDVALAACRTAGRAFVSGATGLQANQYQALDAAGAEIPVLHATNMTFGMAVLNRLSAEAARMLGDDFDAEIVEMHHRYKKDAPSGSALTLGESIARARGVSLEDHAEFGRHGEQVRVPGNIGFASLRGGDVAGDHTVIFAGEGERLELTFRAGSRRIFANGALRAAAWLAKQSAGRYSIDDTLGS